MLSLAYPLWLLALPLPFVVRWLLPPHRESIEAVRAPFFHTLLTLTGQEAHEGAVILRRRRVNLALLSCIWLCLLLAATKPTWLGEPRSETRSARDLLLAVDLSGSMAVEDFVGTDGQPTTRVDAVKQVLDTFVERRQGDRMGLLVFGAAPFVQAPFTQDADLIRELLRETSVGMAGDQTVLGDAVGLAIRIFEGSQASNRTLVLLTDGNDTGSLVPPRQAAAMASKAGVTLHVVGVGDPRAADEERLNEEVLRAMAETTGGRFYLAQDRNELARIYTELDRLEPVAFETRTYQPRRSLVHLPLGMAVALLVFFSLVSLRQVTLTNRAAAQQQGPR